MQKKEKDKIVKWLLGKRDFATGVMIYNRVGLNIRLKREFSFGETETLKEILVSSLMDLAGITPEGLKKLSLVATVSPAAAPIPAPVYAPAQGQEKEVMRFRDRFPFLKAPDCPDILKIKVADLFSSYEAYKKSHKQLAGSDDAEMMYEESKTTVLNFCRNRDCWELLEFYKTHGTLPEEYLQKTEEENEIAGFSDLDLASKLKSAMANESKHRKSVEKLKERGEPTEKAEGMLQYWTARKQALREELENRKKNNSGPGAADQTERIFPPVVLPPGVHGLRPLGGRPSAQEDRTGDKQT